jgi:type II secretory pathway component PulC
MGHSIGALTTATRRSVIFKSEGIDRALTFCSAASPASLAQSAPPRVAREDFRMLRRSVCRVIGFFIIVST